MSNPSIWQPAASATDGVPNLSYLSGVQIPVPEDGILIFVTDTGTGPTSGFEYQLSLLSGAAIDGYDVVATFLGGASRWLRRQFGGGALATYAFWQPGGTTSGNYYTDFQTVCDLAAAQDGPFTIFFDPTFASTTIPTGAWDFGTQTTFASNDAAGVGRTGVEIQTSVGTTFVSPPTALRRVTLYHKGTAALITNIVAFSVIVLDAATIQSDTDFVFDLVGQEIVLDMRDSSVVDQFTVNSTSAIQVIYNGGAAALPGAFSTTSGLVYFIYSDSCHPSLAQTSASFNYFAWGAKALGMLSSGITANRPLPANFFNSLRPVGAEWFDTTLGIPITWNGAAWINAAGVVV